MRVSNYKGGCDRYRKVPEDRGRRVGHSGAAEDREAMVPGRRTAS